MKKMIVPIVVASLFISTTSFYRKKNTDSVYTARAVCEGHYTTTSLPWCSSSFSNIDEARQAAATHNKSFQGHSAKAYGCPCPGCD